MSRIQHIIGVSYRQFDHWARAGYLRPTGGTHGVQRRLPPDELRIAKLMARMTDIGFTPKSAADYARQAIEDGKTARVTITGEGKIALAGMFISRYKRALKRRERQRELEAA